MASWITVELQDGQRMAIRRASTDKVSEAVRMSAGKLVSLTRTAAPVKTGALRRGIVVSPVAERNATPGKTVYDVYMDDKMNDTFVKYSKGKRYYYPASQEYGFRTTPGPRGQSRRVPGRYFLKNTSVSYYDAHEAAVAEAVEKLLEDL